MNPRRKTLTGILLTALTLLSVPHLFSADLPLKGHLILLDPGHGVINFDGKIINPGKENQWGHMEHKLNMEIAQKLGSLLEKEGARVIYTRTPTDYWRQSYGTIEDNKNRALLANELKAEILIAIHCDWNPSRQIRGVTTYYGKPESRRLGELIHKSMVKNLQARDRKLVFDTYTVLDNAQVPTVLCECGFLSNKEEAKKLARPGYQQEIAKAMAKAVKTYFSPAN